MLALTVFGGAARESRMGPAGEHPRAAVSQRLATGGVASPRGHIGNTRPGGAARGSHDLAPRVPARPEEVTIMQSTYGSDPKGATT
jgi:hypothetical protein